jgi:hypothetical protein
MDQIKLIPTLNFAQLQEHASTLNKPTRIFQSKVQAQQSLKKKKRENTYRNGHLQVGDDLNTVG